MAPQAFKGYLETAIAQAIVTRKLNRRQKPYTNMRMSPSLRMLLVLSLALLLNTVHATLGTFDSTSFFPAYRKAYQYLLEQDNLCGEIYKPFRDFGEKEKVLPDFGDDIPSQHGLPSFLGNGSRSRAITECLLRHTPEGIKLNMASGQVILGLGPSIIAYLAPEPWQAGALVKIWKHPLRHLLVLILIAGSPIMAPSLSSGSALGGNLFTRSGSNSSSGSDADQRLILPPWIYRVLSIHDGKVEGTNPARRRVVLWMIGWPLVYILSLASLANVIHIISILANVIFNFRSRIDGVFIVWMFTGLIVQLLGALAVWPRLRTYTVAASTEATATNLHQSRHTTATAATETIEMPVINRRLARAPALSRGGKRRKTQVEIIPPSIISAFMTWFTTVAAVLHLIFGTVMFSSTLFIAAEEAVAIVLRLLASSVFSRIAVEVLLTSRLRDVDLVYQPQEMSSNRDEFETEEENLPLSPRV
ncbi:hypothetical protein HJFPF1_11861 [Paramyrothecium foliicola]|nr:hypothetical protein HJFPF1_11861 [Paramyrothecium foliicola]